MFYSTIYQSPIGEILISSDGRNITGLWMKGQKYFADTLPKETENKPDLPILVKTCEWLNRYFKSQAPSITELPLAPKGGEFRQEVWKILCEIPYGKVTTYGDIAKKIADKQCKASMSAQAVGGAVGHNPISIIIPCHRVVGSNGSLTGFSGGVEKKIKLLELEGTDMTNLFIPKKGSAL